MKIHKIFFLLFGFGFFSEAKVLCEGNCQIRGSVNFESKRDLGTSEIKKNLKNSKKSQHREDAKMNHKGEDVSKFSVDPAEDPSKKEIGIFRAQQFLGTNGLADVKDGDSNEIDGGSNLPKYFANLGPSDESSGFVVTPGKAANKKLKDLYPGSVLKISINQDVIASGRVTTPIVGKILEGPYKESTILGEAILDEELKRVLFNFKSMGGGKLQSDYQIKASGLDVLGRVGMIGEYHADDFIFGLASFFATATAVAVDSQVERSRSITGEYVDSPSLDNTIKKSVAGSLGKVADRLAQRAMNSPGRTELRGPLLMQIVLDEVPVLKR